MISREKRTTVTTTLLTGLVTMALVCACLSPLAAETDMTYRLTNPDFESGLTGWTTGSDGTALHYNEAAAYETPQSGSLAYHVGPSSSGTHAAGDASYITQAVDLTGVDTLTFWHIVSGDHPSVQHRVREW